MGGHYEKDLFRQLQEVMERCDRIESKAAKTKVEERAKTSTQINTLKKKLLNKRLDFSAISV